MTVAQSQIHIKCGACKELMIPEWATVTLENGGGPCPACSGEDAYTCFCNEVDKTLEFRCSKCQYYGRIDIL